MYRKMFIVFSLILTFAMLFSAARQAFAKSGSKKGLSKHDRELLAEAVANGQSTVTLLIAAQRRSDQACAQGIQSLGGTVRFVKTMLTTFGRSSPLTRRKPLPC